STTTLTTCSASVYSVISISWQFGDPASGLANTSTLASPTHTFSSGGTYTVQMILTRPCTTDTTYLPITLGISPTVSILTTSPNCLAAGSATATASGGTGPY